MRRAAALGFVATLVAACSGGHAHTLGGYGLRLSLPHGWYGVAAPGQLQAADFPLRRSVLASAGRARVGRGHVHLIVWDYGPALPFVGLGQPRAKAPLRFRRQDLTGPLEGFPLNDAFAVRSARFSDELVEILADLGPKPLDPRSLHTANRVVASLRVAQPRVIRPHRDLLARGGVALRLLPGWDGWIEIPSNSLVANFVFFAHHGDTRVVLFDERPFFPAHQVDLPLRLSRYPKGYAHRVVLVEGHGLEVSATFTSARGFADAERLVGTLTIQPHPWSLSLCDFSLRVPGPWKAGVRRRGGCYLIVTLRARGLRVVLEELRPSERVTGRVISRAGRRFEVQVTPRARRAEAFAVLATFRARPRSAIRR